MPGALYPDICLDWTMAFLNDSPPTVVHDYASSILNDHRLFEPPYPSHGGRSCQWNTSISAACEVQILTWYFADIGTETYTSIYTVAQEVYGYCRQPA